MTEMLAIDLIRIDGGTQVRVETDITQAESYAEDMRDGAIFPPVVVFHNGGEYWLADGFHRLIAAEIIGWTEIEAEVREGGQREAILCAVGANATHGLKRSRRDKRNAINKMLTDPVVALNNEGVPWSDWDISRRCVVSPHTVVAERASLPVTMQTHSEDRAYTTKHGTTAIMNTGNIGARPKGPTEYERQREAWGREFTAGTEFDDAEPYQTDIEDFAPTPQRPLRFTPEQRSEAAHIRYFLGEIDRRLSLPPATAAAAFVGELHSDAEQIARVASWLNQFQGELYAEMRRREGLEAAD